VGIPKGFPSSRSERLFHRLFAGYFVPGWTPAAPALAESAAGSPGGKSVRVSCRCEIRRVADISATQGHIVPTSIAYHGNFFVGNLNTFPIQDGSSKILKITPSGHFKTVVTGLTTVLGVAFDCEGYLYILENTTGNPFPTPFTGKVLRVTDDGLEEIATGLFLPTAMTFGPDGDLYVSTLVLVHRLWG